jgi:hypothetical protein
MWNVNEEDQHQVDRHQHLGHRDTFYEMLCQDIQLDFCLFELIVHPI